MFEKFKDFKIGKKIMTGYGVAIVLIILISLIVLITNLSSIKNVATIQAESEVQVTSSDLNAAFLQARLHTNLLLANMDPEQYANYMIFEDEIDALFEELELEISRNKSLEIFAGDINIAENYFEEYKVQAESLYNSINQALETKAEVVRLGEELLSSTEFLVKDQYDYAKIESLSGNMASNRIERMQSVSDIDRKSVV